jgi:hypothetical protein
MVTKPVTHVGYACFHLFDIVLAYGIVEQNVLIFNVVYEAALVRR